MKICLAVTVLYEPVCRIYDGMEDGDFYSVV